MKKKIILTMASVVAIAVGVVGMSAFEAHIINVTAKIENALSVDTTPIHFGTVFPQEAMNEYFDITLSQSFLNEGRVDDINYMLRQKPKCWSPTDKAYGLITEDGQGNFVCVQSDTADDYAPLPLLCPFLSKHEMTTDGLEDEENDSDGINAFHGPALLEDWTLQDTKDTQVLGRLAKSENDTSDTWQIDFRVPCFNNECAQDWDEFVEKNHPGADPNAYILPEELEHALFGCDLWVEVTEVSLSTSTLACSEKADVMLTLDRSGSIDSTEMSSLKTAATAFVTALNPETDGAHMGETSFSTQANLDVPLTHVGADVITAINALSSGGNTNLEDAILTSNTELAGDNDRTDGESPDFMVIITDGNPTACIDIDGVSGCDNGTSFADAAKNAATTAKNAGVVIYVVGVGSDVDEDYLKNDIASSPSLYFNVADYTQLQALLEGLATCD